MLTDEVLEEIKKQESQAEDEEITEEKPEQSEQSDSEAVLSLKAILHYLLGLNYSETEENGLARKHLQLSIDFFEQLSYKTSLQYLNILQDIFNQLGLQEMNSDNNERGFAYLAKAEKLYTLIIELIHQTKTTSYNLIDVYNMKLNQYNQLILQKKLKAEAQEAQEPKEEEPAQLSQEDEAVKGSYKRQYFKPVFRFFYQGGLNYERT